MADRNPNIRVRTPTSHPGYTLQPEYAVRLGSAFWPAAASATTRPFTASPWEAPTTRSGTRNVPSTIAPRLVDCGDVDIVHGDQKTGPRKISATAVHHDCRAGGDAGCPGRRPIRSRRSPPLAQARSTVVQFDAHLRVCRRASRQPLRAWQPHAPDCPSVLSVDGMAQLGIRGIGSSKRGDFGGSPGLRQCDLERARRAPAGD